RLFFFQAEDGIRDGHVTGVQTCALPISELRDAQLAGLLGQDLQDVEGSAHGLNGRASFVSHRASRYAIRNRAGNPSRWCGRERRSEERRVGKGWRSRRGREQLRERAAQR